MLMMLALNLGVEMVWDTRSPAYAHDAGLVFGFLASRTCG